MDDPGPALTGRPSPAAPARRPAGPGPTEAECLAGCPPMPEGSLDEPAAVAGRRVAGCRSMLEERLAEHRAMLEERLAEHRAMLDALSAGAALDAAARAAAAAIDSVMGGGRLILFGNGGSAADATHLAAELLGRFLVDRRPLAALALADNHAALTAIGNDYAYEQVFARQLEGLGRPGDTAIGLSTSGASLNVAAALQAARALGMATVAMTGADPGIVGQAAEIVIAIPAHSTPRIQEAHMLVGHTICEAVERALLADGATHRDGRRAPARAPLASAMPATQLALGA